MKPDFEEGDIVAMIFGNDEPEYYMVQRREWIAYDYTFTTAITTGAIGSFEEITNLQPKMFDAPAKMIYQLRVGVDIGTIYTEMMSSHIRNTPYRQQRPSTTSPYVGYFNEQKSPFISPTVEFLIRFNEVPAFSVYNNWGFSITPKLSFRGWKLMMYELKPTSAKMLHVSPARIDEMLREAREMRRPVRRITALGVEE